MVSKCDRNGIQSVTRAVIASAILLFQWPINGSSALATPPHITSQPQSQNHCNGGAIYSGDASFYCGATGTQPLSYQWRRGTTNLVNGGNMAGANSAGLTIQPTTFSDAASDYNCLVTNAEGSAVSNNATLTVFATGTADVNGDGIIDGRDVQGFVILWLRVPSLTAAFCAADMDGSGRLECEDLCAFAQALLQSSLGCGVPPENDDCPNASLVTTGNVYNGNTGFATRDGPHITCDAGCAPACDTAPDVWFQWVADFDGRADFLMCDYLHGYDAIMAIYDACPAVGGIQLACNDDGCFNDYTSRIVSLSVTTGQTYWICISGWKGTKGCFPFRVVPYTGP